MTLAALIRGRRAKDVATAIPAIPATQQHESPGVIAKIATIAVATRTSEKVAFTSEAYDERAAIIEFDGGFSRAVAESLATLEIQNKAASPLIGNSEDIMLARLDQLIELVAPAYSASVAEIEIMKDLALRDVENALTCFSELARQEGLQP